MSRCVRSGFCCKDGHCPHHIPSPGSDECRHLEVLIKTNEFNLYRCALYCEGKASPEVAAALKIGDGCEFEFNDNRRRIAYSSGPPIDWSAL